MTTNAEITQRWFDVAPDHARMLGRGYSATVKPSADGRELYSYGSHFPMVRAMLGRDGTPSWWLLNGDRFSNTTSRHQSDVRGCAERTGLPTLIVPFSALDAAGIVTDSIRIIEVTPDTWSEHERTSANLSDVPRRFRTYSEPTPCAGTGHSDPARDCPTFGTSNHWHPWIERDKQRDADGLYRWTVNEHRLGSAVFRARYAFDRPARRECRGPFDQTGSDYIYVDHHYVDRSAVCRHGRSVNHRATIRETGTADFLSGFDMQENPPLYFLAQLPKEQREPRLNVA